MAAQLDPPQLKREPHRRLQHGDVFTDHYAWLDAADEQTVTEHHLRENRYAEEQIRHLGVLREQIFDEIAARTQAATSTAPVRRGMWWYFFRYRDGQQYGQHCRRPVAPASGWDPPRIDETPAADEQLLLDENAEAQHHDFFAVGASVVSPDGQVLAYTVDTTGNERFTLRFKNLADGRPYPDEIGDIAPSEPHDLWASVAWSSDSRTIYYVAIDDSGRPCTVRRHRLGHGRQAELVYHESDKRFHVFVRRARSGKYIFIAANSLDTSEIRHGAADDPQARFRTVLRRRPGVAYTLDHAIVGGHDRFVIAHNDDAPNFTVVEAPVGDPEAQRTLIPHRDDVQITVVEAFAGYLAVGSRHHALTQVELIGIDARGEYERPYPVAFDSDLMSATIAENPAWDAPMCRIEATSYVTPSRVYDVAPTRGRGMRVVTEQSVRGGFRRDDYVERREWVAVSDGTRIPVSIIHRRDVSFPAPTLLYGYGAFGCCDDSWFSIPRLSVLDRGMVFVVAHVRGGGDLGKSWHEGGRLMDKKNSFDDFISVARHLIDRGITRPHSMVAFGGSAGGLLVGAAANMAPELFAGILAVVPVVDPLTTLLHPSSYVDTALLGELGDPADDRDIYHYIKSYSPYENIQPAEYPRILAIAALRDTRVAAGLTAKWVAALRYATTGAVPILLKTDMAAGHTGISGRYEQWKQAALEYAWMLDAANCHVAPAIAT
ncbi:S9 family peptidase [Mycobacterium sp. Y57]|uniref:S9 family peptidase n=1 Tax=Mycolicibacterium xanthum TaxID=2796469 RepID=UPI001C8437BB|nr:S9 family peptidase [Mycolicibacterium xanthum]MBX7435556.1 S9 family peptidase [Mycolicibacterium xanthum]